MTDPNNPAKNREAVEYVIRLEIQKTIAIWDEYVQHFDIIDELINEKREEKKKEKEKLARDKEDDEFKPSDAINSLEKMRGTLIFRITNMQKEITELRKRKQEEKRKNQEAKKK